MSTVYRAEDVRDAGTVAVKVLDDSRVNDPEVLSRFRREARIEAALAHPNIAAYRDFDEAEVADPRDGRRRRLFYLVIEWVPGEDLTLRLADGTRLPTARILHLGRQIAAALGAAHDAGVVHRDLKPSNIRITPEGVVKVLDFGFAKILEDAQLHREHPPTFQTTVGSLLGTARYMAPEQLFGRAVDHRTDLFALGVILYQMATGQVPFSGRNIVQVLQAVSTQRPVAPSELDPALPAALDALILECLDKEPGGRPATAHAVLKRLQAVGE